MDLMQFKIGTFYKDKIGIYLVLAVGTRSEWDSEEYVWYVECDAPAINKITLTSIYELSAYNPVKVDWKDR